MAKKSKPASEYEESLRRPVSDETLNYPVESTESGPLPLVESAVTQTSPIPLGPDTTYDELPEWFVVHHKSDLDDVAARARASGKVETTAIRTPIIGSGNMGTVVVYSDGVRLWSPHNSEIESWFGHLKR